MIGLCITWSGEPLEPPAAARFAAALAVGTTRKPHSLADGGALFAAACAAPHRPIRLASGEILLFSGHIANRAELRGLLDRPRADDAALYAAAYAAWGDAADLRVIGDFCTIVCDPAERRVRLARAPLAGQPLHYHVDDARVIVATTPRAIFATGLVEQALDEQKIADTLYLNYREGERSFVRDVRRLPSATRLVLTPGRERRETYYDPLDLPPVRFASDEAYVEAANALLAEGTRAALDGFDRPAVSLSGGFDSQAVAAHTLRVLPEPVRLLGLTSVPEPGWDGRTAHHRFGDEREHVQALAGMYPRLDIEWVAAPGLGIDHHLQSLFLLASVAPRNAMNMHWIHEVSRIARVRGCDVVLTGAMGNLSFSFDGAGTRETMLRTGRWLALTQELRAIRDGRSFVRKLANTALPFAPPAIQRWRDRRRGIDEPLDTWCALNPEYAREMHVEERAETMGYDPLFRRPASVRAVRAAMLGNARMEAGDLSQALELLHGIERRDPSAYRPLVEFCVSIPDDQYLRRGQTRWLARRMLRGVVPDMVLAEKRRGVQAADWFLRLGRERGSMVAEIDRLAADPAMAHRLNLKTLRDSLDDWPSETPIGDARGKRLMLALTRAISTARFIRFVEGANR